MTFNDLLLQYSMVKKATPKKEKNINFKNKTV